MIRLSEPQHNDPVEESMLALDPGVVDAIWASFAAYLPQQGVCTHPLGCHRPRISDRDCFEAILFRLVTGCSWDVAGRLGKGSETTLRRRRDEWVAAGAFAHLVEEAISAFDKMIGLDFSDVSIDGSLHKAPTGAKGPDRTLPIGARPGANGHWPPTPMACPSAGS
jgi:putative transposase